MYYMYFVKEYNNLEKPSSILENIIQLSFVCCRLSLLLLLLFYYYVCAASLSLHATTPSLTGEIVCVCVNFLCYKKDIIKSAQKNIKKGFKILLERERERF